MPLNPVIYSVTILLILKYALVKKSICIVTIGALVNGIIFCSPPSSESRKPNIIFILADDLGYGDLGSYGQKLIKTPNIDRLASDGMRFTQVYAGSAVCAPSRSVLMTGLNTGHTRVRGNASRLGQTEDPYENTRRVSLEEEDITVAELLKKAAYTTGVAGKWGIGEAGTAGIPTRQGFDEWLGYLNQNHAPFYYTDSLWRNDAKEGIKGNDDGNRGVYTHDLFTEFALDFIHKNQEKPFFLYLPYCIPHREFEAPDNGEYADKPWPEAAKTYAAMISRLDRDVGRIVEAVKKLGLDENTLILFASDNGAEGKPDAWKDLYNSTLSFRGNKSELYEGGIRVPMIARWPGKIKPSMTSDAVWSFTDFLPTLADVADISVDIPTDGISILPTLLGKEQITNDRFLYWEFQARDFTQAVRWQDWKAIRVNQGAIQLYDLARDVGETEDVAATHPDVIAKIETYLKDARSESKYWPLKKG